MTKIALLTAALLVGASGAAFAKSTMLNERPGVSDDYAFSGSANGTSIRQDDSIPGYTMGSPEAVAMNRLAAQGYGDISNLHPVLGGYTALAVKDGKVMEVEVDASGNVHRLR